VLISPAHAQLISNAHAQAAAPSGSDQLFGFLPIILMFVVLYFLMIRPQMKRAKEHKTMLEALKKGDEVVTSGGLVGKVTKVGESYVTVEVARAGEAPVEMHFQKGAVQTLLPNGTIKAL
jgi:preprotein translocase subunit YajC